jgi:hypothetical protein
MSDQSRPDPFTDIDSILNGTAPTPGTDVEALLNSPDTVPLITRDLLSHVELSPDNPDPPVALRFSMLKQILGQIDLLGSACTLLAQEVQALKDARVSLPYPPSLPVPPRKRFMRKSGTVLTVEHGVPALVPAASVYGGAIGGLLDVDAFAKAA